jgi:hypothetical protein
MKMFWKVLGMENDFYTTSPYSKIVDRKTNVTYEIGDGQFFLKKDYPQNIIENINEFFEEELRYGFYGGGDVEYDYIEKKGIFGKTRRVYFSKNMLGKEYIGLWGLWKIDGLEVYTDIAADYIRDKSTGIEYVRGERILFRGEDLTPFPLAEHTDKYEFIFEQKIFVGNNDLQEIRTILTTNSIFNKK